MLELAGEMADGVLMNWTGESFIREAVEHVKHGAERVGRDPSEIDIAGYVRVACGGNEEAVRSSLRGQVARYASNTFYRNFFVETGFGDEMTEAAEALAAGDMARASEAITQEMQDQLAVVGTAGRVPRGPGAPTLRWAAASRGRALRHRGQQGVAPSDHHRDGAVRPGSRTGAVYCPSDVSPKWPQTPATSS